MLIGFLAGAAYLFLEHLRTQLPLWRARSRYEHALERRGKDWDHAELHRTLMNDPASLYSPDDDAELRTVKAELIMGWAAVRRDYPRLFRIIFIAPLVGMLLFAVLGAVIERM